MGTTVNPAYIERLQEDIIIACRRLEENGHESLVLTVSEAGHLVFGSEKGKLFLGDRDAFIAEFIQCCQNIVPSVKVERDLVDGKETPVQNDQKQSNQHENEASGKDESDRTDTLDTPRPPEITEPDMFDDDTDDYDETETFDSSLLDSLATDSGLSNDNGKSADTAVKEESNKVVKKENLQLGDMVKSKLKNMPEARVVLKRINHVVGASKRTGLKPCWSKSRTVRTKSSNISNRNEKNKGGTPTCDVCGKTLSSWEAVKRHKLCYHQSERPYVCEKCGANFKLKESLKRHEYIHGDSKYACEICGKLFPVRSYLTKHMVCHSKSKPFVCEECGRAFSFQRYLIQHRLVHTGNKPHKCEGCEKEFGGSCKCMFKEHLKAHKLKELTCNVCGKVCACKSKLERHRVVHTKEKKVYKCEICGKIASCSSNLQKHMVQHTNEKPYVCDQCGKAFAGRQHLQNHIRLHTGEKPYKCTFEGCKMAFRTYEAHRKHICYHSSDYPFICDFCGRRFKEISCMRHHRKKHTIEFRWSCDYCPEKFKTLVRFKTHIVRSHVDKKDEVTARTNIKFWPCTECPKVFGQKEDFEQHMNVHLGLKPFKCNKCNKAFSSKSNLLQHIKGHTGYNRVRCKFCSKSYSDPKMFKQHLKNRHGHSVDSDTEDKNEGIDWRLNIKQVTKTAPTKRLADEKKLTPAEQQDAVMSIQNSASSTVYPVHSNSSTDYEPLTIDEQFLNRNQGPVVQS